MMNENKDSPPFTSNLICHAIRLLPGMDLYQEILSYLDKHSITAATILTCVGSLKKIHVRTATAKEFLKTEGSFEIVSLVGCVSPDRSHVHISLSDVTGKTIGGHLMTEGNIVYTTAEIVLGVLPQLKFGMEVCELSGWDELKISNNK